MKSLTEHLTNYAAYHRDRRNIATHFIGIPMIVLGVATLLARPAVMVAGTPLGPVVPVTFLAVLFYLALDLRYGLAMAAVMAGALAFGTWMGAQATSVWLTGGLALFLVGWAIQFVGHIFEGRKPAFVDDLVGLLIGPLFVVAEAGFAVGLRLEVVRKIEHQVGPTRSRPRRTTVGAER